MSLNAHHCWAIFTTSNQKANKIINQIIDEQNIKNIKTIRGYKSKDWAEFYFEDGNCLRWIGHTGNFRGFRFHRLWCDKDINKNYFECVILPMACYMKYEDIIWILGERMSKFYIVTYRKQDGEPVKRRMGG